MEQDDWLKIRISSSQLRCWKDEAAQQGVPLSPLVRAALLGRAIHRVPQLNQDAWRELAAAAANINQLAHRLNSAHAIGEDMLLATARDHAAQVVDALQTFRAALLGAKLKTGA